MAPTAHPVRQDRITITGMVMGIIMAMAVTVKMP